MRQGGGIRLSIILRTDKRVGMSYCLIEPQKTVLNFVKPRIIMSSTGHPDLRISRFCARRASALMLALIVSSILAVTGCSKHEPASQMSSKNLPNTNQASASQPPPTEFKSTPVVITANPAGGADLKQLNHAYVGWIVQHHQAPKTFEEFISLSGMKVPPPPVGKKYVIDKYGFINYANN